MADVILTDSFAVAQPAAERQVLNRRRGGVPLPVGGEDEADNHLAAHGRPSSARSMLRRVRLRLAAGSGFIQP